MTVDRAGAAARRGSGRAKRPRNRPARIARWTGIAGGLVLAVAATLVRTPEPVFIWNVSASAPLGLYRLEGRSRLAVGDMVAARVPQRWRGLAAARRYVPPHVPLIKRVAAAGGDRLCARGADIFVNGKRVAQRRERDGAGRSMPAWSGCATLGESEYLLLMPDAASFDGRYFGPTGSADLVGRVRLLWER